MKRLVVPALLPFVLLGTACFPKTALVPTSVGGNDSGRTLFVGNCNKCHGYPDVNAKPADKWPKTVHRMSKKAHLGPDEEQKILAFVLAAQTK